MQHHVNTEQCGDGDPHGTSEWCREEHGRFMQALELYGARRTGEEWKHITDFVGSRTMDEVRLHGRQYLEELVHQVPRSPVRVFPTNRFRPSRGNQTDPNGHTYDVPSGNKVRPEQSVPITGSRALSAAALECAHFMTVRSPLAFRSQALYQQSQPRPAAMHARPTSWTFQEEKAFEVALATWVGSQSYPWTTIAATVPGKTEKDVRTRFNELVGEIASIEARGHVPSSTCLPTTRRQQGPSSLSQRAQPPPPIQVSPRQVDKDGATDPRSRRGSASGIQMLSPTFLDLLATEAEHEDKSPLPAFAGLLQSPFPLFSPTARGFCSPGKKNKGVTARDKQLSHVEDDGKVERVDSGPTSPIEDGRRATTPRIWKDFLAHELKRDDELRPTARTNMSPTKASIESGNGATRCNKVGTGEDTQDVEMTDATTAA
ncbi:hypothetical protein PsorP6_015720 [Peronosclerospora sorghi]|uniref:Uncharacterized protein n=1 Tax=Peronosclerospora sorghi TaxID=230839 RepID=A0ACC0WPB0_9STRA|nr:hypothetical protein PsorP6_015720 [Peronosclerospora sorghi]